MFDVCVQSIYQLYCCFSDVSIQLKLSGLSPNNIYDSIYSRRFPRKNYSPASVQLCSLFCWQGRVDSCLLDWSQFWGQSVPSHLSFISFFAHVAIFLILPQTFCSNVGSLLLTYQCWSSQLQMFSQFVSLWLQSFAVPTGGRVIQWEVQADWDKHLSLSFVWINICCTSEKVSS